MPIFKDPLVTRKRGERAYVRQSVKDAVFKRAKGKCEYPKCGKNLRWGDKGTGNIKGRFHHIRKPSISPTEKTVRFVCPDHHDLLHEHKSVKKFDPFFGDKNESKIIRKDTKARPRKNKNPKRRRPTSKRTVFPDFSKFP